MHAVATLTKITGVPAPFDFDADLRAIAAAAIRCIHLNDCFVGGDDAYAYAARVTAETAAARQA